MWKSKIKPPEKNPKWQEDPLQDVSTETIKKNSGSILFFIIWIVVWAGMMILVLLAMLGTTSDDGPPLWFGIGWVLISIFPLVQGVRKLISELSRRRTNRQNYDTYTSRTEYDDE